MTQHSPPDGWTAERIAAVAAYYEGQPEDEAASEFEGALARDESSLIEVPSELVAAVRSLIDHYESIRAAAARV